MMNSKQKLIFTFAALAALFIILTLFEQLIPQSSMLFVVLKKGAIYALVAVSMNLLNGSSVSARPASC